MVYLGVKISEELETLIVEEVKRSDKSKSDIVRDALNQYFNVATPEGTTLIVLDKNALIDLIDSRLRVKPEVKPVVKERVVVKPEVKPEGKTVKREVKLEGKTVKQDVEPEVKHVLQVIKDFHDRGIEPTAAAVAEAVGIEARPLGRMMKAAGLQAKNTTRNGVTDRYYLFDLKERIEEILAAGELEGEGGDG
jgi:rRNA-processing protein FCF1